MSVKRRMLHGLGQGLQQGAQTMMNGKMRMMGQAGKTPMGLPQADLNAGMEQIGGEMAMPDLTGANKDALMRMLEQMFKQGA